MSNQSERLTRMMKKVNADRGVEITYHRNNMAIGPFTATPTKPQFTTLEKNGTSIAYCDREYLIEAALLLVDGAQFEPEPGDWIIENGKKYEVAERRDGQQCFRPMDSTDAFLRVFTFNK